VTAAKLFVEVEGDAKPALVATVLAVVRAA
jgi:hypothetical protein